MTQPQPPFYPLPPEKPTAPPDNDWLEHRAQDLAFMVFCAWAWKRSKVFRVLATIAMAYIGLFVLVFIIKFITLL